MVAGNDRSKAGKELDGIRRLVPGAAAQAAAGPPVDGGGLRALVRHALSASQRLQAHPGYRPGPHFLLRRVARPSPDGDEHLEDHRETPPVPTQSLGVVPARGFRGSRHGATRVSENQDENRKGVEWAPTIAPEFSASGNAAACGGVTAQVSRAPACSVYTNQVDRTGGGGGACSSYIRG